jgi:hypothetical protein
MKYLDPLFIAKEEAAASIPGIRGCWKGWNSLVGTARGAASREVR